MPRGKLRSVTLLSFHCGVALTALLASAAAYAQPEPVRDPRTPSNTPPAPPSVDSSQPGQADQGVDEEEIIITGTQIRGIAPAGANVIGVSAADIQESGAARGNDILSNIPQISNFFNAMPDVGAGNPFGITAAPISRPNLRSLPGNNVNSGSLTLILMDGHRLTPSGLTQQIAVDPDVVPSALLERVELMPDGASAVYGSDALGGVINFITRKSFNGLEASARYGFGKKGYNAWDASITAGKDWGSGSAFISFSYSYHDPIFGKDRDFIKAIDWNPTSKTFGLGTERSCEPGNIQIGSNFYPLSTTGAILGVATPSNATLPNACDPSDFQTFYSRDRRRAFFAGFSQELTDSIRLDIRGFSTRRTSTTFGGPFRTSFVIPRTSSLYRSVSGVPGAPAGDFAGCDVIPRLATCPSETVRFSYDNILPLPARTNILDTWQVTPALTWDITSKWQVRALATYGKNQTGLVSESMLGATQTARLNAGIINPFDLDASAPGAFDNLVFLGQTRGHITFKNYRLLADGPLFTLPGGEVRIAAGAEYISIDFSRKQTDANFVLGPSVSYKQTVKAVFGEMQIPIVGEGNRFPGVYSLLVQGSVRRDKYNDFGSTTNPNIGVTYEPVSWVKLRGIWGKSFVAPSATAQLGQTGVGLIVMGTSQTQNVLDLPVGAPAPPPGAIGLLLNMGSIGGLPGEALGPQTSKNWSIGGEVRPPFVPGLSLSTTLYNIKVKDILATPVSSGVPAFYPQFPTLFRLAPPGGFTPAEIAQWVGLATPASQAFFFQTCGCVNNPVVVLVDNRLRNLGSAHVKGIDFSINYRRDIGFGTVDLSIAGNHELVSTTQNGPGLPVNNLLRFDAPKWKWAAGAGLTKGPFRGKLTWNHTGGFDVAVPVPATNADPNQTHVRAFNTVDAFFSYDLGGFGIVRDVQLTLNINNVLDEDPPILRRAGFQNFGFSPLVFTVGRFIQFGIRTKL